MPVWDVRTRHHLQDLQEAGRWVFNLRRCVQAERRSPLPLVFNMSDAGFPVAPVAIAGWTGVGTRLLHQFTTTCTDPSQVRRSLVHCVRSICSRPTLRLNAAASSQHMAIWDRISHVCDLLDPKYVLLPCHPRSR